MSQYAATLEDVQAAAERIKPFAHETQVRFSCLAGAHSE